MATFVLRPCRVRHYKLVEDRDAKAVSFDWDELRSLLAPTRSMNALRVLTSIRPGAFIGLVRTGSALTNFLLYNPDQTGDMRQLLKADPGWADRVECAYKVLDATFDRSVVEIAR